MAFSDILGATMVAPDVTKHVEQSSRDRVRLFLGRPLCVHRFVVIFMQFLCIVRDSRESRLCTC